ncbi:MAG TPA: hypothetical protein PL151_07395 [Phycisphaerae bacterium]|nr:hypothetical protein [Phycisphaerae bacterium]HOJ73209.1 hypothetical protein [Phycisphaerae bacterium]HOM51225.1 hypothetical protein [Phycisphaerae bacterium]HON67473.1 hypothetical protein [Phycisphaerae bacterium]HOQ87708.1 hypothetical protein [Phycisphaerae bacterium]
MQFDRARKFSRMVIARSGLAFIGAMGIVSIAPAALAQAPAAPKKPEFPTIRKTQLATIDRNNVEAWINAQIQQMFAQQDDAALQTQGREFYEAIAQSVKAGDATAEFREGVATILADSFVAQYPKAPSDRRPLAVVYPLMALNAAVQQPTPKMIQAFTMALSEPTPGGRLLGVSGLLTLQKNLNQQQWTELLPVLQKTGAAETSGPVLARIYRLLALPANAPVDPVPAVLAILDARLSRLDQKQGWPVAADAVAIKWLGERMAGMSPELQNRATLAIARLMTDAVYAYVSKPGDEILVDLEKVVLAAEKQLTAVVTRRAPNAKVPSPTLAAAMLDSGPGQKDSTLLALNKWIGTAQQPGVLNQAPFNFEPGLKVPPPAAAAVADTPAP